MIVVFRFGIIIISMFGEKFSYASFVLFFLGLVHYVDMEENGLSNTTGYASADLQLMTLEYELFQLLPFNFCGDFIKRSAYNFNYCPQNGKYHFEVPYTLPQQHDDYATWFASGWAGTSYLSIHTARDADSPLLAHCKLEFKTFVTQSNESGWQTLPSAAVVTLILAGIVACMFSMLCFMACQPRKKHVTDDIYENEFRALEEESPQQAEMTAKIKSNNKNKRKSTLQVQADSDWLPLGDADWAPESPQGKALQAAVGMKTPQEP